MIDVHKLTNDDVGREVTFTYAHGETKVGRLSSWNDWYVFVRFLGPGGEACDPKQCEFSTSGVRS